jgi:tetratricopeptide (TPR) repeat protein
MIRTQVRTGALLLGLLLLTGWIYWPGLAGPILLDDAANLERVQALVAKEGFAVDVLTDNPSGPLGRPVSMASFMLDLYLLDGGIWGAKFSNLLIHLLTGVLVWLFSLQLFTALGVQRRGECALWVAAMWLLAPLLVSTTLYMVQRMAQRATLFSLMSLCAYLRWRRDGRAEWRSPWWALALISVVLAILSKENAVLALPLLVLLELAVLQPRDHPRQQGGPIDRLLKLHLALVALGLVTVLAYLLLFYDSLLAGYGIREFSLGERLLTQPRVLWHYLAQLLWVDGDALGLYHDAYHYSTGLTRPGTTLWALLGWGLVVPAALLALRFQRWRGVGFGLLFFLVGHVLEGSIFPLELYFEHRNYLPAVGLFVALVTALAAVVANFPAALYWSRGVLAVLLLHALLATAVETQIWSNGRMFHLVAESRFPDSVRANEGLALEMAALGDAALALDYVARVEALDPEGGFRHRLTEAMVYCRAEGRIPDETFLAWEMSEDDFRDRLVNENSYNLARKLIGGACPGTDLVALADHWGGLVLRADRQKVTPKLFLSLAILENHLQRYEQALYYVNRLLQRSPNDLRAQMMRLYFAANLGRSADYEDSLAALTRARDEGRLNAQERYNLEVLTGEAME